MAGKTHRDHGRTRYQKGCECEACVTDSVSDPCRCVVCTTANRDYSRRNKRLKSLNGGQPVGDIPRAATPGPRIERDPARLVETLVQSELDDLPAADKMKGLGAAALAMGRILDDPTSAPQHPSAAGQLLRLMVTIRVQGEKTAGRTPRASRLSQQRGRLQALSSAN